MNASVFRCVFLSVTNKMKELCIGRICKHSRKPQRRQVDTDEFAGGGTYFYCNVQVADNSSSYHGNLEYGRYADCILGHSGSSEAKLQVTGIYVELLRVGHWWTRIYCCM